MKDFRIIEILKTFSQEELKFFKKFLDSPFAKSRRNLAPLFEVLTGFHPYYNSQDLTKESIFKKIFPKENFNDRKIMNLIFEITAAAENFLIHKTIDEDEIESLLMLSKGYYNKKMLDNSMRILKQVEKKLEPGFSISKDYFSKMKRVNFLRSAYYTEKNEFEELLECKQNYFEISATQFIVDFAEFLSVQTPVLNTHGKKLENFFIESVIKSFDIDKLIKLLGKDKNTNLPIINLHYYKLKTIEEPDVTEHYYVLRDYFYGNLQILNREEKFFLFNHLVNYCVNDFINFKKEGLEVYKKMLENDAYSMSDSEYMQPLTFRNIYQFCRANGESVWFKFFIDNYTNVLPPELRKDLSNFAYAYYYFMIKEFEKAHDAISGIRHEFFIFKSDLKNLLLTVYYELNYTEQAYSLIDTHRHFLSKNKEITGALKDPVSKFLKYYSTLLKIKNNQSNEDPGQVKSKITKEDMLTNKSWLVEKANELLSIK